MKAAAIDLNWNDEAVVELSREGKQIWEHYWLSYPANVRKPAPTKLKMQLWQIAQIFGPHLSAGCAIPWTTMNFKVRRWKS